MKTDEKTGKCVYTQSEIRIKLDNRGSKLDGTDWAVQCICNDFAYYAHHHPRLGFVHGTLEATDLWALLEGFKSRGLIIDYEVECFVENQDGYLCPLYSVKRTHTRSFKNIEMCMPVN